MTKKFHILLIILTLGIFATPTLTYACGTKSDQTEKSCCKKSETEKDSKKTVAKVISLKTTKIVMIAMENAIIQIVVAQPIIVLLQYLFGLKQK
ncbi:MAG: hypothetical protein IPQ23_19045 [Cytophagaceae bacterium]|nr:hypothetical protein [Cytophagaceae bacterium]